MNRDVFLSILAMDSHHRDPKSGFKVDSNSKLGNAVFLRQSEETPGSLSSGFFASVYDWNGEKIISYAGTNDAEGEDLDKPRRALKIGHCECGATH